LSKTGEFIKDLPVKALRFLDKSGQSTRETAKRFPFLYPATETGETISAGAVGTFAPEDSFEEVGYELVGGLVNPMGQAIKISNYLFEKVTGQFGKEGRQRSLGNKIRAALENTGEIKSQEDLNKFIATLRENDLFDGEYYKLAKELGLKVKPRTSAQKTGSETLFQIERKLTFPGSAEDPEGGMAAKAAQQLRMDNRKQRENVQEIIKFLSIIDDPAALSRVAELKAIDIELQIREKFNSAVDKAREAAEKALKRTSGEDRMNAGKVFFEALRKMTRELREKETQLYNKIDGTELVETAPIAETFKNLQETFPENFLSPALKNLYRKITNDPTIGVAEELDAVIKTNKGKLKTKNEDISTLKQKSTIAEGEFVNLLPENFDDLSLNEQNEVLRGIATLARAKRLPSIHSETALSFQLTPKQWEIEQEARTKAKEQTIRLLGLESMDRSRIALLAEKNIEKNEIQKRITRAEAERELRIKGALTQSPGDTPTQGTIADVLTLKRLLHQSMQAALNDPKGVAKAESVIYGDLLSSVYETLEVDSRRLRNMQKKGIPLSVNQQAIVDASVYSKKFHDVYSRGFAGKAIARGPKYAYRNSPELMFDEMVRGSGDATSLRHKQLGDFAKLYATSVDLPDPELPETLVGSQNVFLRAAARDVFDNKTYKDLEDGNFDYEQAFEDGVNLVDERKLSDFLEKNKEVLEHFPSVKDDLQDAKNANRVLINFFRKEKNPRLKTMEEVGSFANFRGVKDNPNTIILETIGTPGSRPKNPVVNFERLANEVLDTADDKVKNGFKQSLLQAAWVSAGGTSGKFKFKNFKDFLFEPLVNGKDSPVKILQQKNVFSDPELLRLNSLLTEFSRLEKSMEAGGEKFAGALRDAPSAVVALYTKIMGSALGRGLPVPFLGNRPGGLIEASAGARFLEKIISVIPNHLTTDFLYQAVQNPQVMADMLERSTNPKEQFKAFKRLQTYLKTTGFITAPQAAEAELETELKERAYEQDLPPTLEDISLPTDEVVMAPAPSEVKTQRLPSLPPRPTPPPVAQATTPPVAQAAPSPVTRGQYAAMFPLDSATTMMRQQQGMQAARDPMQRGIGSLFG
jgi:hypothetical protein